MPPCDIFQWLLWHKETNILFAAEKSGAIYIWKIPNGQCKLIPGYGSGTECGMLLPDGLFYIHYKMKLSVDVCLINCIILGKRLVVGYNNRSIRVFDLKAETVIAHTNHKPK